MYVARDVVTGNHQREATISGLVPLLLPGVGHAEELLETLRGPRFGLGSVHMVPSYDMTAPGFDPARYWRGPSWFNMAWLIDPGAALPRAVGGGSDRGRRRYAAWP